MVSKDMLELGKKSSVIREIFEYSKIRANEIGADKVYDFSLGNPSVEPPKQVVDSIKELLETENQTLLHGYTSAQGDLSVRTTVSNNINERFNLNLTPNHIYMTCGAAASLSICLKAVVNSGDECIVFAPFFTEYRVFVEKAGGTLVSVKCDEDDFQPDLDLLEKSITYRTKAVIINSPNSPTGAVMREDTIKKIAEILDRKSKELVAFEVRNRETKYFENLSDMDVGIISTFKLPFLM